MLKELVQYVSNITVAKESQPSSPTSHFHSKMQNHILLASMWRAGNKTGPRNENISLYFKLYTYFYCDTLSYLPKFSLLQNIPY